MKGINENGELKVIQIHQIKTGNNDRKTFNDEGIKALAASIDSHGMAVPIIVRETRPEIWSTPTFLRKCVVIIQTGEYELIAGERRLRAHQLLGRTAIEAIVRNLDGRESSNLMLIENVAREGLRPVEEAMAYRRRMHEYGWSMANLAQVVGVSRETIRKRINLLKLPEHVLQVIGENGVPLWAAEEIDGLDAKRAARAVEYYLKNAKTINRNNWRKHIDIQKSIQSQGSLMEENEYELKSQVGPEKRLTLEVLSGLRVLLSIYDSSTIDAYPNEKKNIETARRWLDSK